jgi:hypothetical protein
LLNLYANAALSDASSSFSSVEGIAVAANLLPQTLPSSPVSLQELWNKGLMTPPISNSKYILFGMLTESGKTSDKKATPGERGLKFRFQHGDGSATALVHFDNAAGFKSTGVLKLYDMDNHVVASSPPEKLNISRGEHSERVWQLPLANLPAGIYRVDIEVADGVAWRQYFKLTD